MPANDATALTHYRRAARSKSEVAVANLKRLKAGQHLRSDYLNRIGHIARMGPPDRKPDG